MTGNTAVPASTTPTRASVATRHTFRRVGLGLAALTALAAFAARAQAQTPTAAQPFGARPFALRPVVGAFVPTGDQRDLLKDAVLVGAQASYTVTRNVAVVGTFGWSPSKDRTLREETVDLFQYDVGVEGRLDNLTPQSAVSTRPYLALGGGGRTYSYRNLDGTNAQTNVLGYGAVGLDLAQRGGPVGVRVEARDNVTGFKGLRGELADRKARNDVQFSAGLTLAF
jgi:hypothetical protein